MLKILTAILISLFIYCIYTGEQMSGINKICYYDCAGSPAAITVPAYDLCPMSIDL